MILNIEIPEYDFDICEIKLFMIKPTKHVDA